ncbi:hypothetical protein UAY_03293 [Enterococcus moraviensis ATCC BAA-383]|uniref:Uncharacterized protein n=1 Tax=Enterococcus moraviensis ATCC BAA-383 TaxID=1158609 RepID=R2QH33_9ENTE|nr:hypothetical protein UAY_03293 [Enterococcus moraviensis ATCC BAA-383]EOT66354.1 hypothetical protein I586_02625 [Enterococcus moraviensis ATCC BAA-383]
MNECVSLLKLGGKKMTKEKKTKDVSKKNTVDAQVFIQRKLQTLNQKNGGRYERDATRVVQNNQ